MKICFIVGAFPNMKCGIGDYTNILAYELSKRGAEISIITSKKGNSENLDFKIYNICEKWDMKDKRNIINLLKDIKPDYVHIQYPSDEYRKNVMINFLPKTIKRYIGCKVVITIHEFDSCSLLGKIRNSISAFFADKTIVVETNYINSIKKYIIKKNFDIEEINISSNIPKVILNDVEKKQILKKYNINGEYCISYFGFANPNKGIENLLYAISNLSDTKLLFIGELIESNEYHISLLKMIDDLNIKDRIIITGFMKDPKDVAKHLATSNLCVLPFKYGVSQRNGSFLAAYNQNISVLTTTKDKDTQDKNGIYYCENANREALLQKIIYIKNNSNDIIDRQELNWKLTVNKHIKLYETM